MLISNCMPLRKHKLTTGNYYHVFNRGVEKRKIFLREQDFLRFSETMEHCLFNKRKPSSRDLKSPDSTIEKPVELLAYCLMPNHFHLLLKQNIEKGIESYLQRLSNSYAKYFNTKYKRVGSLFQGPFRSVNINSDEQLLHLSRYIHLNPVVAGLAGDPKGYRWSSYSDYIGKSPSRNTFVNPEIILGSFSASNTYEQFTLDQIDYGKKLEDFKHLNID